MLSITDEGLGVCTVLFDFPVTAVAMATSQLISFAGGTRIVWDGGGPSASQTGAFFVTAGTAWSCGEGEAFDIDKPLADGSGVVV